MRKLKCRAKNVENKWVYGYYAQAGNDLELKGVIFPERESVFVMHEVNPKTVGMLLGIVNGVEIYTGDILRNKYTFENSNEYPMVIVDWNEKTLSYELQKLNGLVNPPLNWITNFDLIGNKIDNPELIPITP